jgi:hypothetical protein
MGLCIAAPIVYECSEYGNPFRKFDSLSVLAFHTLRTLSPHGPILSLPSYPKHAVKHHDLLISPSHPIPNLSFELRGFMAFPKSCNLHEHGVFN